jgi:NTP pyrophosphatase (non-canonical NTP hydrolase)
MDLGKYQLEAKKTDQDQQSTGETALIVPLLGLSGEAASLLTEYKKWIRDGSAHTLFKSQFKEELGDILWYLADLATKLDLNLDEIAEENIKKTRERWPVLGGGETSYKLFDDSYKSEEQIPRTFDVHFSEDKLSNKTIVRISVNNVIIGDVLTDNSYEDDGYRYHDAFHLAYAAKLGWSPVVRRLLHRKRKSNHQVDEVEDGARAAHVEEAISIFIYSHAKHLNYFAGVDQLDYSLLRTVRTLTHGLEVSTRSIKDWQDAILYGYEMFRKLKTNGGGTLTIDITSRMISFTAPKVV